MTVPQQSGQPQRWVLAPDAVRKAIRELQPRDIHESLPAYLHLRRRAKGLGRFSDLQPEWQHEPAEWMDVPGGPPGKPYFRPFTSRGASPNGFWLNKNLAGSYAKSSLRKQGSTYIDLQTDTFSLPVDVKGEPDPGPILSKVLLGAPIPAWAVAAFIFRNRVFELDGPSSERLLESRLEPEWPDINAIFFDHFGFTDHERRVLFTLNHPLDRPCEEWRDA